MVERREAESLEPEWGEVRPLREVGGPGADEIPSLCAELARARMLAGYELKDVATALRIRLIYLEALEEGRFEDMPGMTYVVGFLRSYSEYLKLDPDEMISRLKGETASGIAQKDLTFPMPPKEGGKPKPWLILVVLVLAGLAYGGWRVYSTEGQIATNLVSDVSNTFSEATGLSDDDTVMASVASEESVAEETSISEPVIVVAEPAVSDVEAVAPAQENAPFADAESVILAPAVDESVGVMVEDTATSTSTGSVSISGTDSLWQEASENAQESSAVETPAQEAPVVETPAVIVETVAEDENTASVTTSETPLETATSVSESAPQGSTSQGSTSLWDSAGENSPSEASTVPEPAFSASSETLPIVSNAQAQELDSAANPDEFEIASASPETSAEAAYEPNIYGVENSDFRIAITAKADSWVQIQGPNNELLLTRILRTGDTYQVPDRTGLIMVTGNAGALELRVDGAVVNALGPVGVVRRNVPLDPEALIAGTEANR